MSAHELQGDERILWGVVANAGRRATLPRPRWAHVMDATGLGSTRSTELCRRFDFDPSEMVPKEPVEADDE